MEKFCDIRQEIYKQNGNLDLLKLFEVRERQF